MDKEERECPLGLLGLKRKNKKSTRSGPCDCSFCLLQNLLTSDVHQIGGHRMSAKMFAKLTAHFVFMAEENLNFTLYGWLSTFCKILMRVYLQIYL